MRGKRRSCDYDYPPTKIKNNKKNKENKTLAEKGKREEDLVTGKIISLGWGIPVHVYMLQKKSLIDEQVNVVGQRPAH